MSASVLDIEMVELTFGEVVQMETCIKVTLDEIHKRIQASETSAQRLFASNAYALALADYGHLKAKLAALYPNTPRT